jgi:hypothetical protein
MGLSPLGASLDTFIKEEKQYSEETMGTDEIRAWYVESTQCI